jgi:hypothetical protein
MSPRRADGPISKRVDDPPSLRPDRIGQVSPKALGIRFLAGAATSVVAGVLTIAFGPRLGGIMLAFPAILAASLTLIASEEDRHEAREDARGAVLGGCALAAFAAVCALAFTHWNAALVLATATGAWLLVALGGYLLVWFRLDPGED